MKKVFVFFFTILLSYTSYAQKYSVKLDLNTKSYSSFVLSYNDQDMMVEDTINAAGQNRIEFGGKVSEAVLAYLTNINPELGVQVGKKGFINSPDLMFFLTNEVVSIKGDGDRIYLADIHGGKYNKEWNRLHLQLSGPENRKWEGFKNAFAVLAKNDSSGLKKYHIDVKSIDKREDSIQTDFIGKYPGSIVSMMLLSLSRNYMQLEELKRDYSKLGSKFKTSVFGRNIEESIAERLRVLKTIRVGKTAENFIKNDINSNKISLVSLRGKVVLLNFWGSWCVPCRASHPHLKTIYDKYKNNGLEIIGIAYEIGNTIEACRKTWQKAVKQDKLDWIQVLNNEEGKKNDIVEQYGINSYPTNILIDRSGEIIGIYKENDTAKLDEKLKEIFK